MVINLLFITFLQSMKFNSTLCPWNVLFVPQTNLFLKLLSQNHRAFEVSRDALRSSCPTPLLSESHLEPVAQDRAQTVVLSFHIFLHVFYIFCFFEINPGGFKCFGLFFFFLHCFVFLCFFHYSLSPRPSKLMN